MPWPFTTSLILLGFFLLRFAMARSGVLKRLHRLGALLCFAVALGSWQLFSWTPWLGSLLFFLLIILPIVEIVLTSKLDHTESYWI